jgi:hypothetical protein
MPPLIHILQQRLAQGDITSVFHVLMNFMKLEQPELETSLVALSGQFSAWQRDRELGLTHDSLTGNRIHHVLAQILAEIAKGGWTLNAGVSEETIVAELKERIRPQASPITWDQLTPFFVESYDILATLGAEKGGRAAQIWRPYTDKHWTANFEEGCFCLENTSAPQAVKYHWINWNDAEMTHIPVSVEVMISHNEHHTSLSGAGLILCFREPWKHYLAFVVQPPNRFLCLRRDDHGMTTLAAGRSPKIQADQFTRLGAIRQNDLLQLFIGEQILATLPLSSQDYGEVGVIALSTGKYLFDNLTLYSQY